MKDTIFYLEGRSGMHIYHFFIYNLGGLYYILNNIYNHRGNHNTSVLFEDKSKIVPAPSINISFPIKIYMKDILPFQREAFEIIKDKITLIDELPKDNYEIISIYGETCDKNPYCDNTLVFNFLRNLFIEKLKTTIKINTRRIFLTRNGSNIYHGGTLKRYIKNEKEIMEKLKKYNFEYIQLENYNTEDKIKIFMESEIIISSHSSGLLFTLFCNKQTKIIEILNKGTIGFPHDHYLNISRHLNLNYFRYNNINEDINGNFDLDFNNFEPFLFNFI